MISIDLTNCDKEPIHIPESIQPHGVLLALEATKLDIVRVSNNTGELLARQPEKLLGRPLADLLETQQIAAIWKCLAEDFDNPNPLDISIETERKTLRFDGIVHRSHNLILLELEPKEAPEEADFFTFYYRVKGIITKLQKAATVLEMCRVVVAEIRKMTGFDRVMVYRFDADGSGTIVAEDKADRGRPYLDLRYPHTDIPQPARELYTLNWLRLIPDANYQPVGLIPADAKEPLDLSLSVLRSVSPLHVEYLQNMGVTASMSISLIQDRQLWGLIACHHSAPKYVAYSIRTACEFIGQVMSVELANKAANEDLEDKMRLNGLQSRFLTSLSQSERPLEGLVESEADLLGLVEATGAFVCLGASSWEGKSDRYIPIGATPPLAELPEILAAIAPHFRNNVFHTQSLAQIYPPAAAFANVASGLIALEISRVHRQYILWFRPEVVQTVNWGGEPNKPSEVMADGSLRLSPRKSFALWQETVRGCALPWKKFEIEAVSELRSNLVGILMHKADELATINLELQRSNEELDSFAYIASHDLKEPLRGIHNYSNFLMEDYAETLNEDGIRKLQTLVRLTQRMENLINSLLHYSRLGRTALVVRATNLQNLVQQAIATLNMAQPQNSVDFRIPQPLPTIECDRTQVSELFTNLISNAIKYNNKAQKWVEISFISPKDSKSPIFYVRDNGIGIPERHQDKIFQIFRRLHHQDDYGGGTGAGLTIARKIVERHGGRIWVESTPDEGSIFYFTLSEGVRD
jgi:two-component system, chemotaxis family, sensor kinase Cph1